MSSTSSHAKGPIRVSYDASGLYVLAAPTGTQFPSFADVLKALPYPFEFDVARDRVSVVARNLHPDLGDPVHQRRMMFHKEYRGEVRFYDECGRSIPAFRVRDELARARSLVPVTFHGRHTWLDYPRYRPETFRKAPVAYTGYRCGGSYVFVGRPVRQEKRENERFLRNEDTCEFRIRARLRELPDTNLWEVRHRSDWKDRCWKRHRSHQWKAR